MVFRCCCFVTWRLRRAVGDGDVMVWKQLLQVSNRGLGRMLKSDQTDMDLYRLALYPRYHSGMRKMYFLTFCFTYFLHFDSIFFLFMCITTVIICLAHWWPTVCVWTHPVRHWRNDCSCCCCCCCSAYLLLLPGRLCRHCKAVQVQELEALGWWIHAGWSTF